MHCSKARALHTLFEAEEVSCGGESRGYTYTISWMRHVITPKECQRMRARSSYCSRFLPSSSSACSRLGPCMSSRIQVKTLSSSEVCLLMGVFWRLEMFEVRVESRKEVFAAGSEASSGLTEIDE